MLDAPVTTAAATLDAPAIASPTVAAPVRPRRPFARRTTLAAHAALQRRRAIVLTLNLATIGVLSLLMAMTLFSGGVSWPKVGMFVTFVLTLPWLSIGFWNGMIGTALLLRGPAADDPLALQDYPPAPLTTRTAVVMAIRNEGADRAIARLRAIFDDIVGSGLAPHFDVHVLSDTNDPAIAVEEEALVAAWRATSGHADQIFYRRRTDNRGYKAGNLEEFVERNLGRYEFFLPLDADSFMSATAIAKLARIMERDRRIGILQTLVVGTPASSLFTRAFQFGMRHGMRAYTMGSAWWTGDCGPYWGHNALIRTRAFHDHCRLPVLPGVGPLGGHIMSHDQVEAVLMRRGGYHVRVLVEEGESWEENPPTLPDFVKRELRWCQGNFQYFKLLAWPGLKPVSRLQLVLAILMYLGAPAWMAFIGFGIAALFVPSEGGYPAALGLLLFVVVMFMTFAPKILGVAGALLSGREAARYGGRRQLLGGALLELVHGMFIAPVVAFAVAVFAAGLLFNRKIEWRAQPRDSRSVGWDEAVLTFLPQTLFGLGMLAVFALMAPGVLPWAAPVILALGLSIPFAVLSASPAGARLCARTRLCDIPEEREPPRVLAVFQRATAAT
jgi:membrane glycosyltransferase